MDVGGVQFQVPSDIPKMEVDLSKAPMVSKQGVDPKKREKALTYFRKHNIAIFLDCVLTELYLERPDDPICWFLRFLTKHDVFEELLQSHEEKTNNKLSASAREYSVEWKIPFIIEWLLTDMLNDEPVEPDRFALSWFRWNKAAITNRFFPHMDRKKQSTA